MTATTLALVALAGGLGAGLRYLVDTAVTSRTGGDYPWGTFVVNASGSLVLGVVAGMAARHGDSTLTAVLGTGLLGGYTTFSTATVEALELLAERRYRAALGHGVGMLVVCVAAAGLGLAAGGAV